MPFVTWTTTRKQAKLKIDFNQNLNFSQKKNPIFGADNLFSTVGTGWCKCKEPLRMNKKRMCVAEDDYTDDHYDGDDDDSDDYTDIKDGGLFLYLKLNVWLFHANNSLEVM